ncbi:MAG: hypothetical protein D9V47_03730 [Clostridia bacterium]|nr:MAG: hypothetical protein D9V47_03730 [Clostridia bacterium]
MSWRDYYQASTTLLMFPVGLAIWWRSLAHLTAMSLAVGGLFLALATYRAYFFVVYWRRMKGERQHG